MNMIWQSLLILSKKKIVINCIKTHLKPCEWLNATFWVATKYQEFCVFWLYGNTTAWQVTYLVFIKYKSVITTLQALRYPSSYILYHILISISAQVSQLKIIHVKMFQKNLAWQVNGSCLGWYKCRTWPWPRCLTGSGSADTNANI